MEEARGVRVLLVTDQMAEDPASAARAEPVAALLAEPAAAARRDAGDEHAVSRLERRHGTADLEHGARKNLGARELGLDDGLLASSEAAQLKLNADWVVLSACNTIASDKPGACPTPVKAKSRCWWGAALTGAPNAVFALNAAAATSATTATTENGPCKCGDCSALGNQAPLLTATTASLIMPAEDIGRWPFCARSFGGGLH